MEEIIYLIGYEINEQLYDYAGLKEAIKSYGDYQHPMENMWFIRVRADIGVSEVAENLRSHLHFDSDHLYVMQVLRDVPRQGWLPRSFWKWLKQ